MHFFEIRIDFEIEGGPPPPQFFFSKSWWWIIFICNKLKSSNMCECIVKENTEKYPICSYQHSEQWTHLCPTNLNQSGIIVLRTIEPLQTTVRFSQLDTHWLTNPVVTPAGPAHLFVNNYGLVAIYPITTEDKYKMAILSVYWRSASLSLARETLKVELCITHVSLLGHLIFYCQLHYKEEGWNLL